jgi:hypothetical protein
VPDELRFGHLDVGLAGVGLQHRIDDRVELLLRRLPRLEQVVVDIDKVDGGDRRVGVGVGRQQRPTGPWEQVHGGLKELDPAHLGHSVVGEHDRDAAAAELDLAQRVQRLAAGGGAHDLVVLAVTASQVTSDRAGHRGVVVHGEQHRPARDGTGLGLHTEPS